MPSDGASANRNEQGTSPAMTCSAFCTGGGAETTAAGAVPELSRVAADGVWSELVPGWELVALGAEAATGWAAVSAAVQWDCLAGTRGAPAPFLVAGVAGDADTRVDAFAVSGAPGAGAGA